jgi:DNA (cytosine-5)-methyltransferase 1
MFQTYTNLELFAGAGGLALGLELVGFTPVLLNEIDHWCCATLRQNRPRWFIQEGDIKTIDFTPYQGVDLVSGGFPCQSFSHAGKRKGLADPYGSLFQEFARAVKEVQPKLFLAENVPGLLTHNQGKTLEVIQQTLESLGYYLESKVLNAADFQVPQKRERLFLVGIRSDLRHIPFNWPSPHEQSYTLRDALKAGTLYSTDVPPSAGAHYPKSKRAVLAQVPPGGCWRHLPKAVQQVYMGASYYQSGGKTGIARRLAWDKPCLTLTCSPAQKRTERCHPDETRPLTVREYARIQTFPDEWQFCGSLSSQYKQIGNAVPVYLAKAIGEQLVSWLIKSNSF